MTEPSTVYTDADVKPNEDPTVSPTKPVQQSPESNVSSSPSAHDESTAGAGKSLEKKTTIEREYEQAEGEFGPRLQEVRLIADKLLANYRRYIDACFNKFTEGTSAGVSLGTGSVNEVGVAASPDSFIVWESLGNVAWQENWASSAKFSNETTAECRSLWSDVRAGRNLVRYELADISEQARRAGTTPGVMRQLLAKYDLPD